MLFVSFEQGMNCLKIRNWTLWNMGAIIFLRNLGALNRVPVINGTHNMPSMRRSFYSIDSLTDNKNETIITATIIVRELTTMTKSYYPIEVVQECCSEYRTGTTVSELCQKYQIPRSTMYYWVKKYADLPNAADIPTKKSLDSMRRAYEKIYKR